jgi:Arc/MetJ-type ribon-helix-helix transcriptional regulator
MISIALTDDLERLVRRLVENGQYPNEEAVVEEAVRCFMIRGPVEEWWQASAPAEIPEGRAPGPFLEDEMVLPPIELPRIGQEVVCSSIQQATRQPDRFPGE